MNSRYVFSDLYRRLARTATFIVAAAAIIEPPPPEAMPQGAPHVTVAIPQTYQTQTSRFFAPQIAEDAAVVVEADELHADHRSVTLGKYRYSSPTFARAPQIAEDTPSANLPEGWINLQLPLVSPRTQRNFTSGAVLAADVVAPTFEETIKRQAVWIPPQPYRRPFLWITPHAEEMLPEADTCVVLAPEFENRSRITTASGVPPADVTPPQDLPEGWINLQLPLVSSRQLLSRTVGIPPQAPAVVEADELHPDHRTVYIPPQRYAGKTTAIFRQPTEIDELLQDRRSVTLGPGAKPGKTVVVTRQPTEIDELIQQRRSTTLAPFPKYAGYVWKVTPQQADAPVVEYDERLTSRTLILRGPGAKPGKSFVYFRQPTEIDELIQQRRSVTLGPPQKYVGPTAVVTRQPTEIDELIQDRRSVTLGPPLKYSGPVRVVTPQIANADVVEYDERIQSRVVVLRGPGAKPGQSYIYTRQPDEIDELLQSRRASYVPPRPYVGKSYVYTQKPDELDELIVGRRSVYLPTTKYVGQTVIGHPAFTEPDELTAHRRQITVPQEARIQGFAYTQYARVEYDELLQRRVSIYLPQPYRRHFWKSGNAIQFDDNVYPSLPDLVRTSTFIADLPHTTSISTLPHSTQPSTLPHTTRKTSEDT